MPRFRYALQAVLNHAHAQEAQAEAEFAKAQAALARATATLEAALLGMQNAIEPLRPGVEGARVLRSRELGFVMSVWDGFSRNAECHVRSATGPVTRARATLLERRRRRQALARHCALSHRRFLALLEIRAEAELAELNGPLSSRVLSTRRRGIIVVRADPPAIDHGNGVPGSR